MVPDVGHGQSGVAAPENAAMSYGAGGENFSLLTTIDHRIRNMAGAAGIRVRAAVQADVQRSARTNIRTTTLPRRDLPAQSPARS